MSRPVSGDLWRYPYLWRWQDSHGETEGRKIRPTVFTAVVQVSPTETFLYILPITGQEPDASRVFAEIPAIEIKRAGLTEGERSWIIFDEHNRDTLEHSFYFDPTQKLAGNFSKTFIKIIATRFLECIQDGMSKRVERND